MCFGNSTANSYLLRFIVGLNPRTVVYRQVTMWSRYNNEIQPPVIFRTDGSGTLIIIRQFMLKYHRNIS